MKFWGVTGTNGKTTTTWIFAEFLNAQPGRKCGYVTTVEVNTGLRRFHTGYTTPPLERLREIFAEMEQNGCTDCVMEVSSHAIHQHRTGETIFSGGIFTNLSEDHLDYHKTMEAYFDVKLDFARQIAASHATTPDMGRWDLPPYVVCLDGGYGRDMFNAVGNLAVNVIPVSVASPTFDLGSLQLAGDYNRSNVLCAAALAEVSGVAHETIQRTIPMLKPRWGRLELVPCRSKAKVYVDFAHTPDGLEKVLGAAREFTKGKLWVVFGAGGDRDPMKRPLMGAACAKLADRLVVTSDNPRSEDPLAIIKAILGGIERIEKVTRVEADRRAAIEFALSEAAEGDVVIVAGKGHETTQEIKGVKHPFDDREIVRQFREETAIDDLRTRPWYVLHVKPRTEKKVNDYLTALHVFHYLPLFRKETKVQRRKVVRFLPVFPGYVFTRLFPDERTRVLGTKMLVRTIEVRDPRRMIHQLRQVERARRLPVDLRLAENFAAGEYVKVVSGPLRGLEGQVRRVGAATSIVLMVDILGQALEASVSPADLEKLTV